MKEFTRYERVKAALEHKEADCIPFDLGATEVTGINVNALRKLRKYLGLNDNISIKNKITQIANIEDDLIETLKIDVKGVSQKPSSQKGLEKELGIEGDYDRIIDEWGIGWHMPVSGGHYYDLYKSPLSTRRNY